MGRPSNQFNCKPMRKLSHTIALALFFSCAAVEANGISEVSMIQLIATPERFDGKAIRLIAYLNLEFEGDALYLHREDFDKGNSKNAVSLLLNDQQTRSAQKLSRGYVLVEGVFSSNDRGHFGMFSGSVQRVTRIQSWERRRRK